MKDIELRAPEPADLDLIMQIENDPALWEHSSVNTGPYSRFQLKRYIEENTNDIYTDRQQRFIIETSADDVAGIVDIFDFDPRNCRAEIGIIILPEYRNKGIGLLAMNELERHCFGFLGMKQIYAHVRKDNQPACSFFAKCGFTESGTMKSWLRSGKTYHDVVLYQKVL